MMENMCWAAASYFDRPGRRGTMHRCLRIREILREKIRRMGGGEHPGAWMFWERKQGRGKGTLEARRAYNKIMRKADSREKAYGF